MTWLTVAAAMLCWAPAHSKDWYVSNSSALAANTNDGTAATPLRTLNRLTELGKLTSGDTINLACGDTWFETLSLNSNNSAGNLTIQSWPANCAKKPIINASILIKPGTAWQKVSGKSYYSYKLSTQESAQITDKIEFIRNPAADAKPYFKARYPDPAAKGNNFAIAANVEVQNPVYADPLNPDGIGPGQLTMASADETLVSSDVAGADIHMRNHLWQVTSSKVDGRSGAILTVNAAFTSFAKNDGYVLENKLWMLNKPGEWYFDEATKTLYMASVNGTDVIPPSTLELTVRKHALSVRNIAGIKILNLNVKSTVDQAIDVRDSPNPTLQSNLVQYGAMGFGGLCSDNAAIFVGPTLNNGCIPTPGESGSNNAKIILNTIEKSGFAGLHVKSDGAQILGNFIDQTGTISRTRNVMYGLTAEAPGGTISSNKVTNSAFMGLIFGNKPKGIGLGETVRNNVVSRFCLYYADCGGIYAVNGAGTAAPQGPSTISNNVVADGVGDYQGSKSTDRDLTVGIYLDNFTSNVTVTKNVAYRLGTGIFINGGAKNTIDSNVIHAATGQGLRADDGRLPGGGSLRNNKVINNVFHALHQYVLQGRTVPILRAGVAQSWHHPSDYTNLFKESKQGNYVSNNVAIDAGGKPAQWRLRQSTWPFSTDMSLGNWIKTSEQSLLTSQDSIQKPFRPKLTDVTGDNLITNGSFGSADFSEWIVKSGDAVMSNSPTTDGCIGTCLRFTSTNGQPIQSKTFHLDAGSSSLYYFEYVAVGQMGSKSEVVIRSDTPNTGSDNGYHGSVDASNELGGPNGAFETRWTQRFFTPTVTDSNSRFAVNSNTNNATYLDEVKIFKVANQLAASQLYDPSQFTAIFHNTGSSPQQFACPFTAATGCTGAVNQEGTSLSFPLTVGAGGRVLVFLRPSEWAR